jgi:MFS family permease
MVGIGETYLPAFMLALGMGQVIAGLITTIPLFAGSLLQLVSPWAVRQLGSHRRWVVLCAVCQATIFVPLVIAAIVGHIPVWSVFVLASVYWGASLGCGPAWNTWMGSVVPSRLRTKYFSRRSRASQLGVLAGFLVGGCLLQAAAPRGKSFELGAFAILFLIASFCRFLSAHFLFSTSEPVPPNDDHRHVSFASLVRGHGGAGLLTFLLIMQVCVQISAPYFTPYMRGFLHVPYWQYAAVFGIQFATRMAMLPWLGSLAQRWGADRLLWVMSICVTPMSAVWILSSNFYYLLAIQMASGIFWGGYELAWLLLFFETIPAEERTSMLTKYNVVHSLALCIGSLIGGMILESLGKTANAYYWVFGASSALRAVTVLGLAWLPHIRFVARPIAVRPIGMRPADSALDQPILPSIPEEE